MSLKSARRYPARYIHDIDDGAGRTGLVCVPNLIEDSRTSFCAVSESTSRVSSESTPPVSESRLQGSLSRLVSVYAKSSNTSLLASGICFNT